jgi:hypothetical protein
VSGGLRETSFRLPSALLALLRGGRRGWIAGFGGEGDSVLDRGLGEGIRRFAPDAGAPIFGHVFLLGW